MEESPKHSAPRRKRSSAFLKERERNRRHARYIAVFIALVVAFAAGFMVRNATGLMTELGFPVKELESTTDASKSKKSTYDAVSPRISEAEDLLSAYSLDSYDLESSTYAALEAMMKSTGDPYAAYYTPERYAAYTKDAANRGYAGIGVLFADYNGRAYVVDVFEGSEAEAKGVQQGDFVEAIDGDSGKTWTLTEVVNSLARGEGEAAVITWMRPISLDAEKGREFTTTLTCQVYQEPNVISELHGEVGYVKLRQITQSSARLVEGAVKSLLEQGATSFVLDLRDNPGGYLTQAVDVASLFLQSGVLVQIEGVEGTSTKTASGVTLTDAPVVVLTNGYTSAAAEVIAAALQDNQRAEVVGQTTMGKGSVQVMRELSFGGAIRYTAAYYRTPLGHDINGVGIVPDAMVAGGEDGESDTQFLVALDTARSLVSA